LAFVNRERAFRDSLDDLFNLTGCGELRIKLELNRLRTRANRRVKARQKGESCCHVGTRCLAISTRSVLDDLHELGTELLNLLADERLSILDAFRSSRGIAGPLITRFEAHGNAR